MPPGQMRDILEATFRANPAYELVLFDRLPAEEKQALRGLQSDPDLYGVLCPRQSGALGVKSVCRETALLYLTLVQAGPLPAYVRDVYGDRCVASIAALVLDGALEIEFDGRFFSGAAAYGLIEDAPQRDGHGAIARRSVEALKYAQGLELADSRRLSARLYLYGGEPVTPEWAGRFPGPDAVKDYLSARDAGISRLLERNWRPAANGQGADRWLRWKSTNWHEAPSPSAYTYKLYVSPAGEMVRECFQTMIAVMSRTSAQSMKVGGDAHGLRRPDKIIVYFRGLAELQEAADLLTQSLQGCPPQGVPFTAEIGGDGLLSWGIDPQDAQQLGEIQGEESWRLWVTNRLAVAMLSAKAAPAEGVEPWRFAIDRLALEGIDTESWAPGRVMWRDEGAGS